MGRARAVRAALVSIVVATLMPLAACSEKKEEEAAKDATEETGGVRATTTSTVLGICEEDSIVACVPGASTIADLMPDQPTKAEGEPVRLGMVNTEEGPGTGTPELRFAAEAGVRWINEELGGVDGRPLELVTCDPQFSPAGSQQCAQQMVQEDVVAVLGGFDLFGDGLSVLEQNGIPYVGGIPVSFADGQNPISFQFSGGTWGALLGFAVHATRDLHAQTVSIVFNDFGPITDSVDLAEGALTQIGVEQVHRVPFPLIQPDLLATVTNAGSVDPDAIILMVADNGCVPALQAAHDLRIDTAVYVTGACAAPNIMEAAGDDVLEGVYFNSESAFESPAEKADFDVFSWVVERYGEGLDALGAGVVSAKSLMNLYVQMRAIGGENLTSESIIDALRATRGVPSFTGHSYTCDGEQLEGYPAICSPQQVILQYRGGELEIVSGWIDVKSLTEE